MNPPLEQKIDSLIQITNLILTELLKVRNKIDEAKQDAENTKKEMARSFKETNEIIQFIGNKVFDNHENRIVRLEKTV